MFPRSHTVFSGSVPSFSVQCWGEGHLWDQPARTSRDSSALPASSWVQTPCSRHMDRCIAGCIDTAGREKRRDLCDSNLPVLQVVLTILAAPCRVTWLHREGLERNKAKSKIWPGARHWVNWNQDNPRTLPTPFLSQSWKHCCNAFPRLRCTGLHILISTPLPRQPLHFPLFDVGMGQEEKKRVLVLPTGSCCLSWAQCRERDPLKRNVLGC